MEIRTSYFQSFTTADDGTLLALAGYGAVNDSDAVAAALRSGERASREETREERGGFHFGVKLKRRRGLGMC